MRIVVWACTGPGTVAQWSGELPVGATVSDALHASGCLEGPAVAAAGVWGRVAPLARLLCDGDRVEIYRPLTVDPKVARRERFDRQGRRGAGLFARRRKPGS
ncbi:MAG: RnfH family protein [Burkholderiaceae bacterium]|jgi:putative ubiquitin-RnfH superfamily antitoxin RatB of RatAB toxin-antitoxin module|nr:RnfH family protein [Burkholderiaceae bacterium]